jgi:hypothetical protein
MPSVRAMSCSMKASTSGPTSTSSGIHSRIRRPASLVHVIASVKT